MFCQNCGHVLNAEAKFCTECGAEVTVRLASEKPLTFEQFMASRGAETSGGKALDVQFNTAQKAKQKERSGLFKPKGKKKAEETVQINVGLVELNNEHNELKIKRASSLPITVRKSATDVTVKRVAIEKHLAHNKSLRVETNELKTEWILLYPDLEVVCYIPGTRECFSVEKYKESVGKPYNRVNLYLCRKGDYEAVLSSDETDTEQGDLDKTLADSSGEVILNIPPEVKKYACGDTGKQSETTMTPSSQTIRFGDLGKVLGSYRDTTPSVVSSETSAGTSGSHSDASLDAACGYSQYCQLIDVDDFDVDDLEMQEVILQSSSCTNIGEER